MTTDQMILALSDSSNKLVARICTDILNKHDTIEHQKTICGKFLQHVFNGDYKEAFRIADKQNKHAMLRWLLVNEEQDKADNLIKRNYFTDTG